MPKQLKSEKFIGYLVWRVFQRDGGIYYADGRSNKPGGGKPSLNTYDHDEALRRLRQLDLEVAVRHGLADASLLDPRAPAPLTLEEGRKLYEDWVNRSRTLGGLAGTSSKRYRAVLDKLLPFANEHRVSAWNAVTDKFLAAYLTWLEKKERAPGKHYAPRTIYLEGTRIKQMVKWLIKEKHIPETCRLTLRLKKPRGTNRYCWKVEEVEAMIDFCAVDPHLYWLRDVIVALSRTGLRISELAQLHWSDLDKNLETLTLTDERFEPGTKEKKRTTKSGRDRTLHVHESLKAVLRRIPRSSGGLVFRGPRGGVLKPDTVRNVLIRDVIKPLLVKYPAWKGTGFAKGRLHSFRHFFCSQCCDQRIPMIVVMNWLGHTESQMVLLYYHRNDAVSKQMMQGLRFDAPRRKSQSA